MTNIADSSTKNKWLISITNTKISNHAQKWSYAQ